MKKILFSGLIAFLALSPLRLKAETVPATDSRITFVGRSVIEDGSYRFDFPSTYFRVAFAGKTLSVRLSDTKRNFYAVWLDTPTSAEPTHIIEVKGNDTIIDLITLADTKKSKLKEHQVVLQRLVGSEQVRLVKMFRLILRYKNIHFYRCLVCKLL